MIPFFEFNLIQKVVDYQEVRLETTAIYKPAKFNHCDIRIKKVLAV